MNPVLPVFFALGVLFASAADPVVFNNALLAGHADFVKVLHGGHVPASGAKLRFLFLLPKVAPGAVPGFKTGTNGDHALGLLDVPSGHHLVHLFGLSDCSDWLAVDLAVFDPAAGLVHKFMAGPKATFAAVNDLDAFVTFLKEKVPTKADLDPLWPMLPAHPALFKLHASLA